jgi:signal peptide peptidase SppA
VFVCNFPGDVQASQVINLREEVTGIVRTAHPGDEAVVVIRTGGGTVTGYGLATAQLLRLKQAGLKLTIAVEQVAASGGYMMCCVGDRIVASPFAVLGSIGVLTELPNVYERLKTEGIEFQTVTAGKYKRTLTPTKKVTKQDYDKTKQDIEDIFNLFRNFVKENRPQLNIDEVATGETWFGTDALQRGLCDEIRTVDDLLTEYVDNGYDVFQVEYRPPPTESPLGKLLLPAGSNDENSGGIIASGIRWLVRTVVTAVQAELSSTMQSESWNKPINERYMAMDDTD